MTQNRPTCYQSCFHRHQTGVMCAYGKVPVPHPQNGKPCLYQHSGQGQTIEPDYKTIAAQIWNLPIKPTSNLLKIADEFS